MGEVHAGPRKRLRRYEIAGDARALNFSCFHNQPFLTSSRACGWLTDAIGRALPAHDCELWAYCFLPTHVHLLILPRGRHPDVAAFLESTKKSVARRALAWVRENAPAFLRRMRDEQPGGSVSYRFWQRGGGYDRNLRTPRAIWNMIDYIHGNPVEAGMCRRPEDWPWSSAAFYRNRAAGPLPVNPTKLPARPAPR